MDLYNDPKVVPSIALNHLYPEDADADWSNL